MRRVPVIVLAAVLLCTSTGRGSAETSGSPGPNQLYGHITSNRTLTVASPGPNYEIIGDLTIDPGVTLTIERGVVVTVTAYSDFIASGVDRGRVEIVVKGTCVLSAGSGSVPIQGSSGAIDAWRGFDVNSGGTLALADCILRDAQWAVRVRSGGTLTLTRTSILSIRVGLAVDPNASVTLADCSVAGPGIAFGTAGIEAYASIVYPDSLSPKPTTVTGFGIGVQQNAANTRIDHIIARACGIGIEANGSNVVVNYCTSYGNAYSGFALQGNGVRLYNSIAFGLIPVAAPTGDAYCNYVDAFGTNGSGDPFGAALTGSQNSSFDTYFQSDLKLHPASLFTNYSVSGGEIGAYGPGPVLPTPVLGATVVDSKGMGGIVRIRWHAETRGASKASVYRRSEDGDWQPLEVLYPDGLGYVSLEDRDVEAGARYGYGVGFQRDGLDLLPNAGSVQDASLCGLRVAA